MRTFVGLVLASTLTCVLTALALSPAFADKPKPVKEGDLIKSGYLCKGVDQDSDLCTRGKGEAVYGCDKGECVVIGYLPLSHGNTSTKPPFGKGLFDPSPGLGTSGPAATGTPSGGSAAPAGRLQ